MPVVWAPEMELDGREPPLIINEKKNVKKMQHIYNFILK
jgi:hypothetical protein